MKKLITSLTAAAMITASLAAIPVFAADDISVVANGAAIDFSKYDNVTPYIENDYTLIPVRAIAESLGLTVDWEEATRTVTAKNEKTEITLIIDSDTATVNGDTKTLGVPARITDDRTFIPLRFVSENMGADVEWDGDTKTITITGDTKVKELSKIDNTKWQFNADDNAYWQVGIQYCANPADATYETLRRYI